MSPESFWGFSATVAMGVLIFVIYRRRFSVALIVWVLSAVALLLLTGCTAVMPVYSNDTVRHTEYVWQGMHALDTAQTVTGAHSPDCFHEANPLAAAVYGSDHPTPERVMVTNVALAYAHAWVGAWLDRHTEAAALDPDDTSYAGWYLARHAFYGVSLVGTGFSVLHNASERIGPFTHVAGCDDAKRN